MVGAFRNGLAAGEIDDALQPISALRLVVQSDADMWAVLSEVWPENLCMFMLVHYVMGYPRADEKTAKTDVCSISRASHRMAGNHAAARGVLSLWAQTEQ